MFPFFNFGPKLLEGGFMSSLKRKAFEITLTDNLNIAHLSLEETINEE